MSLGVWLVGVRGSVAVTTITGAARDRGGPRAGPTGLVTMREPFAEAGLPALGELVFGGHDVVETPLDPARGAARRRRRAPARTARGASTEAARGSRGRAAARASAGARRGPSRAPRSTAPPPTCGAFRARHDLDRVVVVNVSSTEPPVEPHPAHDDPAALLERARPPELGCSRPSSLYALAAIETGCAFVDFTPSTGARLPGARGARRDARACRWRAATARPARRC